MKTAMVMVRNRGPASGGRPASFRYFVVVRVDRVAGTGLSIVAGVAIAGNRFGGIHGKLLAALA